MRLVTIFINIQWLSNGLVKHWASALARIVLTYISFEQMSYDTNTMLESVSSNPVINTIDP